MSDRLSGDRLHSPDVVGVLPHGAIGGKWSHGGNIRDGRSSPLRRVPAQRIDSRLRVQVRRKVGQQQVVVTIKEQGIDDGPVPVRLTAAESSVCDIVQGPSERLVFFVMLPWIVTALAQPSDLGCTVSEYEDVVRADRVAYLDVGSVLGPDGQRPIQRQLHIAGTRGLRTGGGNLLGQIRGWHDQ